MVRAILAGTKTQTRRPLYVVRKQIPTMTWDNRYPPPVLDLDRPQHGPGECFTLSNWWKKAKVGDRLWVRESLAYDAEYGHYFSADRTFLCSLFDDPENEAGYSYDGLLRPSSIPSIHLPRRYCRIVLELTGLRVERLCSISPDDAIAEGVVRTQVGMLKTFGVPGTDIERLGAAAAYLDLWDLINGTNAHEDDPWVVVMTFRRLANG